MKWNKKIDRAPRDGSLVALLRQDGSVALARFGEYQDNSQFYAWFDQDFEEAISETSESLLIDFETTDEGFVGWVRMPST
jgi:hypothetical protein